MSFFRKKALFILLLGIILMVLLIGYSLTDREELSTPEKVIMDSVGWVQNIIDRPVSIAVDAVDNVVHIYHTFEENNILRKKLAEYKTSIYEIQELKEENKELRETLEIVDSPRDYEPIIANVIARTPERWIEEITINRGKKHGIKENMAVMTIDGMVGKVNATSATTSRIKLISGFDQLNRISATIIQEDGKKIFGLIEGYDKEKEKLVFSMLEQSDKPKLEEDDLVVSSNLGGQYPDGLPIGKIDEVISDQFGLTKTAYIEPAADLFDLSEVIVVNRSLQTTDGDIEEGEEE